MQALGRLMWEQLHGTQLFQSVVMSCTGNMAVIWLTKYRDIVQEHYQLGVSRPWYRLGGGGGGGGGGSDR